MINSLESLKYNKIVELVYTLDRYFVYDYSYGKFSILINNDSNRTMINEILNEIQERESIPISELSQVRKSYYSVYFSQLMEEKSRLETKIPEDEIRKTMAKLRSDIIV